MNRKSAKALEQIIQTLKIQKYPGIGDIWKHETTGQRYRVVNYAIEPNKADKATPIEKVLYTSHEENGAKVLWTRNVDDFRKRFKKEPIIISDFFRNNE